MKLLARKHRLLTLLQAQSRLALNAGRCLWEGASQGGTVLADEIRQTEQLRIEIGNLEARITKQLQRTWITPLDPDDILGISLSLKKIAESVAAATGRIHSCSSEAISADVVELTEIIHRCTKLLNEQVLSWSGSGRAESVRKLAATAGQIVCRSKAELLAAGMNPIEVIKRWEMYDAAGAVLRRCVASEKQFQRVLLKNG